MHDSKLPSIGSDVIFRKTGLTGGVGFRGVVVDRRQRTNGVWITVKDAAGDLWFTRPALVRPAQ
jgi:hypothetical protein